MISDSAYAMWRAVFSLAHIDGIITDEEKKFMRDILYDVNFSLDQRTRLEADIQYPQDPVIMYKAITHEKHKEQFFQLAKTMVWIDGDYAEDERQVIDQLKALEIADEIRVTPTRDDLDKQISDSEPEQKDSTLQSVMSRLKAMMTQEV